MHLKPNALRHLAKHKLRDATQPHSVEALVVFVGVVSSIAVGVGPEVTQFLPTLLGVNAEVERDVVVAAAEEVEKRVGAVDHGERGTWTGPRWNHGKPALNPIVFKGHGEVCLCATKASCLT